MSADSFVIDAETFQKLQPREYLRKFIRGQTRPDGRQLQRARKITISTGLFMFIIFKFKMSFLQQLGLLKSNSATL